MSVYVITGTSSGIGFEILRQVSEDSNNIAIGLVRNKDAVTKKVASEIGNRPNVHILHADLTKYTTVKQAAEDAAKIVGERGVDYLIANGAYTAQFDAYDPIDVVAALSDQIDMEAAKSFATNVTGNIHLFHSFMPLVLKGKAKKVIALTSGHGDLDFINSVDVEVSPLYSASKAALNVIVAKYSAQYKKDGVLFFSISPGVVEVGHYNEVPPEKLAGMQGFMSKLAAYAPGFKGPVPVDDAVKTLRGLWDRASIESGFGGAAVSHLGTKQWL